MDENGKIYDTIKEAALTAVEASKPVAICFGNITSISPLTILVELKMPLSMAQLILTETVRKKELKIGDKMILIRMQGGQKFVVIDRM
ncbi:DUF2577 domain-containing protein [Metaclostridioides mangenotii]|uniref:DUF2577 domain-containing protein n=1 Tax=Metaclostridioides mangenotii TaxID=1540 RepID=A0ABS4EBV2_9FIRM|nr:DUF2577 domain-containing protein [Clostridioides mangenotii]MBP1855416.1 hypothetical protein [Clostridioides mangenotii]